MPTPETSITAESALDELEHIFADRDIEIRLRNWGNRVTVLIGTYGPSKYFNGATVEEVIEKAPRFTSFLQGSVINLTANSKLIIKKFFLSLCRIEAIAEGFDHSLILTGRFPLAYRNTN